MNKVRLNTLVERPIVGEWGSDGNVVQVLRTTNFTNEGRLKLDNVVWRDIPEKKIEKKKLQKGDIIVEKSGGSPSQPVGRVVYFDEDGEFLCNNFTSILRPKSEDCFPKYLLYQMFAAHQFGFTSKYQNKTTGIINLKLDNYLKDFQIPLPPLPTQKKIAAILDAADAYRQKTKALIDKYDELAQSLFLDMFGDPVRNPKGWEIKKLRELGTLERGKSKHRPRNAPELLNGPYPLIQTGDVANSGGYIKSYNSTYSEQGLKQSRLWPQGTLCITIAANIAKTGILTFDACFPDSVVGFVPNKHTNNEFIQAWMGFLQKMIEESAPESAQKNINLNILRGLDVINPPIDLQKKYRNLSASVIAQKDVLADSLEKSEDLFNSLLQRAFKGELG